MKAMVIKRYGKDVPIISRKTTALEKKHDATYQFLFMKPSGEQLSHIKKLVEEGKIRPIIDQIISFEDAQKAIKYVETGRAKGKVILKIK